MTDRGQRSITTGSFKARSIFSMASFAAIRTSGSGSSEATAFSAGKAAEEHGHALPDEGMRVVKGVDEDRDGSPSLHLQPLQLRSCI